MKFLLKSKVKDSAPWKNINDFCIEYDCLIEFENDGIYMVHGFVNINNSNKIEYW